MTGITLRQFGGISPRTPPRYLQEPQAQTALNCPAWVGSLLGLPDVSTSLLTVGTPILSIYRFGQDAPSDTQYWLRFAGDANVVRSQVAGDVTERTFWTDGTLPKATDNVLALTGGTTYPIASYRLGTPAPETACSCVAGGTGTGTPEGRIYTYTFVNSWGWESAPAPASAQVDAAYGQQVTLSLMDAPPDGPWNITQKRIYRSVAGQSTVEYLFVDEVPASYTGYTDTKESADLGEVLPTLNSAMLPATAHSLTNLPGGMTAAALGRDVYLCDPYKPYSYPTSYIQTVDYPVVGLGAMDTTLAVMTTGVPYFLQGSHPENMALVKSDIHQACVSKRSIVSMNGAVFYASPDGLMKLSPGGSGLATEALFDRKTWQLYKPDSIHAYQWDGKYVAFYDTGTVQGGFIFDPATGAFATHDIYATAGYNDLQTDKLYLVIAGNIKKWYDGSAKSYTWKSKKFSLPQPEFMTCAQVEAEAYPVTFKLYADGALHHTETVASRQFFRLPPGRARDWEFELTGAVEVFAVAIAQSPQELSGV